MDAGIVHNNRPTLVDQGGMGAATRASHLYFYHTRLNRAFSSLIQPPLFARSPQYRP